MDIMKDSIVTMLQTLGHLEGLSVSSGEICSTGFTLDAMLLAIALSELIDVGYVKLEIDNNVKYKPNRITFFNQLCDDMKKDIHNTKSI